MGVLTTRTYDLEERLKKIEVGTGTMDDTGNVTANNDATQKSATSYVYVPQTTTVIAVTTDDKRTDYILDQRNRSIETKRYPNASTTLVTKTQYDVFNRVFYTEDPYGRREYMGYSASDGPELIRRVQFTMTDGASIIVNNSDVMNLDRSGEVNALYLITDAIKDAGGNVIKLYDGRNTTSDKPSVRYTYDSRNRRTLTEHAIDIPSVHTTSQTVYDLDDNVTEIYSPRYFDSADPERLKMITKFTYSGRNLQLTQEVAVGGDATENGTSSTAYFLDGRVKSTTNFDSQTSYVDFKDSCCGQFVGRKDPLGHGTMAGANSVGNTTHTAVVQDYDSSTHTVQNPADNLTFVETTSSFDLLRRSTARTQWLVHLGSVNPNDPPIAGLAGEPVANGLTSQTYYDSNLTDDQGFDNATGLAIQQLGGGTYNLSLAAVLAQLNTSTGISFATNKRR